MPLVPWDEILHLRGQRLRRSSSSCCKERSAVGKGNGRDLASWSLLLWPSCQKKGLINQVSRAEFLQKQHKARPQQKAMPSTSKLANAACDFRQRWPVLVSGATVCRPKDGLLSSRLQRSLSDAERTWQYLGCKGKAGAAQSSLRVNFPK